MILRSAAVRQGRAAIASPLAGRTCLRALTTDTISNNTTATPPGSLLTGTPAHVSTPSAAPAPTGHSPTVVPRVLDPRLQARFGKVKEEIVDTTRDDYLAIRKIRKRGMFIGGTIERRYSPNMLLKDPPKPEDVTLELLMASQCHMGHNTSLWNPANSRYIYGVRQGIHIISLEQTAAHLRRAAKLVEEVAYYGGLILFVGNRRGQMDAVVRAAELAGGCHLFSKWNPGTITNRDQMLAGSRLKMLNEKDEELPGFERHLDERRPIVPDLVVVLNPLENFVMLHECMLANVPTIGVIDTNADPKRVTYPIPANDDSLRSISVIAGVLGRAGELGQIRRKQAAEKGVTTWWTPHDTYAFIHKKMAEDKANGVTTDGSSEIADKNLTEAEIDAVLSKVNKLLDPAEEEAAEQEVLPDELRNLPKIQVPTGEEFEAAKKALLKYSAEMLDLAFPEEEEFVKNMAKVHQIKAKYNERLEAMKVKMDNAALSPGDKRRIGKEALDKFKNDVGALLD